MSVKSDKWIRRMAAEQRMIEPFEPGQVKEVNGKYVAVDTVPTARGSRTMTVDPKLHRIYLPSVEYGAAPAAGAPGARGGRAPAVPDSFQLLVVGK